MRLKIGIGWVTAACKLPRQALGIDAADRGKAKLATKVTMVFVAFTQLPMWLGLAKADS